MRSGVSRLTKQKRAQNPQFIPSSGNIFEDMGLPNPEVLLAKSNLVSRIAEIIRRRGLTQAQAAKVLGINQPKVSALIAGHLSGFSTDRLFRFLNALGEDIEITVRPHRRRSLRSTIRVVLPRLTT